MCIEYYVPEIVVLIHSNKNTIIVLVFQLRKKAGEGSCVQGLRVGKEQEIDLIQCF